MDEVIEQVKAVAVIPDPTAGMLHGPLQMALLAMKAGMSVDDMRGLLDLQKEYEALRASLASYSF